MYFTSPSCCSLISLLSLLASATQAVLSNKPPANGTGFDYVIVGGGTCGLVLANRLSADPAISVAVIEAGSSQINNSNVTTVGSFGLGLHTQIDWSYESAPQIYANGQPQGYDQGKGLGGTSLINGMTYVRAADAQIDTWESVFGNVGWNWKNLFPYYLKSETFQVPDASQVAKGLTYTPSAHGETGPLEVGWFENIAPRTTFLDVQSAWNGAGFPTIEDPNTGNSSGFSTWPLTASRALNIRWDSARAYLYLEDVARRPNLQVFQDTTAQKLLWDDDQDGQAQASGVEVLDTAGNIATIASKQEVILSAGALKSPVLLEASGIGNEAVLKANDIPVNCNLPSVGFNLQDQPNVNIAISAAAGKNFTGYPTYVAYATAVDLFGDNVTNVEDYVRSQIPSYAQMIASHAAVNATSPEIQEQLLSAQADLIFKDLIPLAELLTAPLNTVLSTPFWTLLPFSRGSVHINGSSVNNNPIIDPSFFMIDFDNMMQSASARIVRKFQAQAQAAGWIGEEISPGTSNVSTAATDEEWFGFFKDAYTPNSHPCGSAAMMAKELGGVVDSKMTVYGTSNVRVVDASILPAQIDGHLTSTLYAVAERAADMVLEKC